MMDGPIENLKAHVLFVDDDSDVLLSLIRALKAQGLAAQVDAFGTAIRAEEYLSRNKPEVAVIDLSLTQREGVESGFSLLRRILELDAICRVIVLTGHGSVEHGVRALNAGAANFLEKPADINHLLALIQDGIRQATLRRSYEKLRSNRELSHLDSFVGMSRQTQEIRNAISFAASTNQSVLITGETGTGKGLCAAILHRLSVRSHGRLVRYQPNFSTADLVNSDLFGHRRGAFTGADQDRKGLLIEANGGTLFLDEIDELPLETQVALLGVLQERSFRPIGSNQEEQADFRLICASNQDMQKCLAEKRVRSDFYHRIAHLSIQLSPLRDRREDIPPLAQFFLEKLVEREQLNVTEIGQDALVILQNYDWPGNVRELQAAVESATYRAQFASRPDVSDADLCLGLNTKSLVEADFESQVLTFKLKLIKEALARNGGNQVHAARDLKLDRSTLRRILSRAGV